MAKKGKKQDIQALLMNVGKAAAGGIVAEIGADYLATVDVEFIKNNPKVTEAAPAIAGAAGLYFMGTDHAIAPAFYGMIGASASGFADDIVKPMEGFNRVHYMNGADADELQNGIDYIEKMQGQVFDEFEEVDSDGLD